MNHRHRVLLDCWFARDRSGSWSCYLALGVSSTIGVYAMLPLYLVSERQIDLSWANTVVALSRFYGPILGISGGGCRIVWVQSRLWL